MSSVFVTWQDPETRQWHPVGRLWREGKLYRFGYTHGAKASPLFIPFSRMTDLDDVYSSEALFPVFANRLLSPARPEYRAFVQMMQVETEDPIDLLGRSGGQRFTDSLELFPCPEKTVDGSYHIHFFSHGIRHLEEAAIARIFELSDGDRLYLMPDPQNKSDAYAIALRTDDPPQLVGYCPRYLTQDFHDILELCGAENVVVSIKAVNRDAPLQYLLLCEATGCWPDGFQPCADPEYEMISGEALACHSAI